MGEGFMIVNSDLFQACSFSARMDRIGADPPFPMACRAWRWGPNQPKTNERALMLQASD
jgi:hypothetical protein